MRNRISTPTGLLLTLATDGDVPAISRLYDKAADASYPSGSQRSFPRIARLVKWAGALHGQAGGLWLVRASALDADLLGCAMVLPQGPEAGARVAIALDHRHWGLGHALDIARELLSGDDRVHWTRYAESPVPAPQANLTRITLAQLLAMPDGETAANTPSSSHGAERAVARGRTSSAAPAPAANVHAICAVRRRSDR